MKAIRSFTLSQFHQPTNLSMSDSEIYARRLNFATMAGNLSICLCDCVRCRGSVCMSVLCLQKGQSAQYLALFNGVAFTLADTYLNLFVVA